MSSSLDITMTVISAKDIANRLKVSLGWVYAHAPELGASRIGGKWIFTEEGLINAYKTGRELARSSTDQQKYIHKGRFRNKERSPRLGKKEEERSSILQRARSIGLIDSDY